MNHSSEKLIELKLNAMANLSESPSTVVLMLSPKFDAYGTKPKIIRQIFPVRLSREEGALYFHQLSSKLQGHPSRKTVATTFLNHFNIRIESVIIQMNGEKIYAEVFIRDNNDNSIHYESRLSECVILAFLQDAPIYIESTLLNESSKSLKMNFVDETGEQLSIESGEKILQNIMSSEANPNELEDEIKLLLSGSTKEQRQHLKDYAIEHEYYEWASYLTEMESILNNDEEGKEDTNGL